MILPTSASISAVLVGCYLAGLFFEWWSRVPAMEKAQSIRALQDRASRSGVLFSVAATLTALTKRQSILSVTTVPTLVFLLSIYSLEFSFLLGLPRSPIAGRLTLCAAIFLWASRIERVRREIGVILSVTTPLAVPASRKPNHSLWHYWPSRRVLMTVVLVALLGAI